MPWAEFRPQTRSLFPNSVPPYRDRLVAIVAGYTNELKRFIESNPGLKSRLKRMIEMPDYSADELAQIFIKMCEENDFSVSEAAHERLRGVMKDVYGARGKDCGIGRAVRNLFEKTVQRHAKRLSEYETPTRKMLISLESSDIQMQGLIIIIMIIWILRTE